MNAIKGVAITLLIAGMLGLTVVGVTHAKDTQTVKPAPIELSITERPTSNLPLWAGIAAIVTESALLLFGGKRR